jgi:hypothetical protein
MATFPREELEQAFRTYWRTGAVGEDWDAWCDLFTDDATYVEHMYGNMRGREKIRAWIVPIMAKYGEIYTAYEWHIVDPDSGRIVVYLQNRRDHPSGQGTVDFPGVTILEYAGNGRFGLEEDWYSTRERDVAMETYTGGCAKFDPEHPAKKTRFDWGRGPDWTRGGRTWADRPRVR